jgi:hypothetical protein
MNRSSFAFGLFSFLPTLIARCLPTKSAKLDDSQKAIGLKRRTTYQCAINIGL